MTRILLVEDDPLSRDMLSRRLRRLGHVVLEAADGLTGVQMAGSEIPDVILMDLGLPGIDGWEATRRLKSAEITRHIPIVVITAYTRPDDEALARQAGCDDYEKKPVRLPRLLDKIRLHTARLAAPA